MSEIVKNQKKTLLTSKDLLADEELQEKVREMFYVKKYDKKGISEVLGITENAVHRFLRGDKMSNYNDDRLEALASPGEYSALDVISNFFQSVHIATKELSWSAILQEMYREEIAEIVANEGIQALSQGDNKRLLRDSTNNAAKIRQDVTLAQKSLETYISLFEKVLDVQKEVSYIKVITEILRTEDPELYKKITRALDRDPAAKMVLEALSREDVIHYWDVEEGRVSVEISDTEY